MVVGLVDPGGGWQPGWSGWLADEPVGVLLVGAVEDGGAGGDDLGAVAVVHVGGGHEADAAVAVDEVAGAKKRWQNARASWIGPDVPGEGREVQRAIDAIPEDAWKPIPYWLDGGADVAEPPTPRSLASTRPRPG